VTTSTEMQQKTVESFCGFGRVVGVILQHGSVVRNLLKRSFTGGLPKLRGLPTRTLSAYGAFQVAAIATSMSSAM
jgi:hypothetical protein